MIERTEELGLAARLPIVVGGRIIELSTLNLDESEQWQSNLADTAARFDIPESSDPAALFAAFARQPTSVMFDLLLAYDVDGALGSPESLRKRMTARELYDALKQMVSAEFPFVTDLRSAAEAFGPQLRQLAAVLMYQVGRNAVDPSQQESSTSSPSPSGDSTPALSVVGSAKNDSSSSGRTARSASSARTRKR